MKTVFIHIGLQKTGTTTIQESLYIEQKALQRRGVLVPPIGQPILHNAGHHNLARELKGVKNFSAKNGTWEDLIQFISKESQKKIILSSEEFSNLTISQVNKMKVHLRKNLVKIIVYIRRQDKMLQSIWGEILKSGTKPDFSIGFKRWLENKNYLFEKADFQKVLLSWSDVFGKENLIVRVLERSQLRGALFHDFLYSCGVRNPQHYPLHEDRNVSPSIKTLIFIQEMKKRLNTQLDDRMAIQYYHWIRQYAGEQGWNTNKVNLIDKELFNTIMRVYEKGNRFIAREYFDRDELFFEPFQEKKITRFEIEDFHSDELLDLFVFVVEKMFDSRLEIADRDKLESQYLSVKAELDAIHASRGWKWLQKLRAIRRMSRVN